MTIINLGLFIVWLAGLIVFGVYGLFFINKFSAAINETGCGKAEEIATLYVHIKNIEIWDAGQMVHARNILPDKYGYLWHKIIIPAQKIKRQSRKKEGDAYISYEEFFVRKKIE